MASPRSWNEKRARAALEDACERLKLPLASAELERLDDSAYFRLGDMTLRISRPGADLAAIGRELQLACELARTRVPSLEPVSLEPLLLPGSKAIVSLWRDAGRAPGKQISPRALGALLQDFHRATDSSTLSLPRFDVAAIIAGYLEQIEAAGLLTDDDLELLRERQERLELKLRRIKSTLGEGVVHGDAQLGNVLVSDRGPLLVNFEHAGIGPREWDLIPRALLLERFGGSVRDWELFSAGYGFDVRRWPGYSTCLAARALWLTCAALASYNENRAEAEVRLRYWRGDRKAPAWQPL